MTSLIKSTVSEYGGLTLLASYDYSLANALLTLFPEVIQKLEVTMKHPWQFWKFDRVSKLHWSDDTKVREYLTWLWQQLEIKQYEDWYSITYQVRLLVSLNEQRDCTI